MVEAKNNIKSQAKKKVKIKEKEVLYKAKSKEDIKEEAIDKLESKAKDCIIVDNK